MTNATTPKGIGLALAMAMAVLGSATRAQEAPADGASDLTPPDMGAPRGEQEYRTCPDREPRPEWAENLETWEVVRALLLSEIYKARTYEAIVGTGDCSCEVKAPSWDKAEAEYFQDYAALDLGAVEGAISNVSSVSRGLQREVRRICREQGNW